MFDTIYFLKDGKIVEVGSFDKLLKKEGYFYSLWQKQNELT